MNTSDDDCFVFHIDPDHGWLQVGLANLIDVGLEPEDFGHYSYQDRGTRFYLEEDCDAPKFLMAWTNKHKRPWPFPDRTVYHWEDAFIRKLPRIHD